ncbi:PLP-dependent transferase [Enterococcus rivorum]|uniref:Cystathionine gamma-synthase n=1 Tax=Enterococcus rivorum TaxID=762845 RepID=A0A1E5L0A0_9ENTE|nr:PLP-dependent transferase [Enterococcus rivorum]MBP2099280.1 cystathionine gamma-synthase [Enterococcus rivorum]OEH83339.1 cystathionine gamma-synthase [Enterococcus rivorum]
MEKGEEMAIETFLAQIGNHQNPATGAINTPLYFSTTYEHPTLGESTGFDYTRTKNPTRDVVEHALAVLENGAVGLATSSGMSAIQLVLNQFPIGSQIVASRDLYGGSYRYFKELEKKGLYKFIYVDDENQFEGAMNERTTAVFLETPSNPLMREVSIEKIAALAHKVQAQVIVDNTFYTPLIQRPLDLGADVVIHSATKYLGGHNDLLAGAVITKDPTIGEKLAHDLNTTGAVLSPFDSWLLIRGLKTLGLRMERHESNARAIFDYLNNEPQVKEVFYPGKGGMISFKIESAATIVTFLKELKIFTFAESLGGVESLITYPTTQTHADIPKELRESYGLTEDLLRISTGIEASKDLIADLKQAFSKLVD